MFVFGCVVTMWRSSRGSWPGSRCCSYASGRRGCSSRWVSRRMCSWWARVRRWCAPASPTAIPKINFPKSIDNHRSHGTLSVEHKFYTWTALPLRSSPVAADQLCRCLFDRHRRAPMFLLWLVVAAEWSIAP